MSAGDPADPTDEELAEWVTKWWCTEGTIQHRLIRALQAARKKRDLARQSAAGFMHEAAIRTARTAEVLGERDRAMEQLATATAMVAAMREAVRETLNYPSLAHWKTLKDRFAESESLATAHDAAVRRAALEDAAKVADEHECLAGTDYGPVLSKSPLRMRSEIATAIRRLAETPSK